MTKIRRMRHEDIPGVLLVEQESFSQPWSAKAFQQELESPIAYYLVAEDKEGRILGYAGFWGILDQGDITNIAVGKDARRSGVGRLLLEKLIHLALLRGTAVLNLEVRASNIGAIALYEGYGFRQVGRRKGFYQKPAEDAILYALEMKEGIGHAK